MKMRISNPFVPSKLIVTAIALWLMGSVGTAAGQTALTEMSWSRQESGTTQSLHGIWGTSPNNVFAVGESGTSLRYDGQNWRPQPSGTFETLYAIRGTSATDVYAVGAGGTIVHYDGNSWRLAQVDVGTRNDLRAVWGSPSRDVFAVGEGGAVVHYDGTRWKPQASNTTSHLSVVWGSSAKDVYATGTGSTLLHYDGTSWHAVPLEIGSPLAVGAAQYGSQAVWAASPNDIYVIGSQIVNVSGTGEGDSGYTVSGGVILHFDGSSWRSEGEEVAGLLPFQAVWVNSPTDVYAVGGGDSLVHFDGTEWGVRAGMPPTVLSAVWVAPTGDVFAVGPLGAILRGTPQRQRVSVPLTTSRRATSRGNSEQTDYARGKAGGLS